MEEYYRLAPIERAQWKHYLNKNPVGDNLTHRLLAILCSMVASIGGGKNVNPSSFAPWLDWGESETKEVGVKEQFESSFESRIMNEIIRQNQNSREASVYPLDAR